MDFYPSTWPVFIGLTVIIGGLAAYLTGRAIAITWRPYWQAIWYMALLTLAIRFLHFALYEEPLLSVIGYLVDFAVLAVIASIGFRFTRANQMTSQYRWLYERTGPFSWQEKQS